MNDTQSDRFAEGLLSTRQVALLCGVTEQEFRAEYQRQRAADPTRGAMTIPKQWIRQGQELAARLEDSDTASAWDALADHDGLIPAAHETVIDRDVLTRLLDEVDLLRRRAA
jgi:homoserine acetyltransferase